MIWSEHDPAAEAVAYVNDSSAADKTDNIWERCPKSQDENLSIDVTIMALKSFEKIAGMQDCCQTSAGLFTLQMILRLQEAIKQVQ